MINIIKLNSVLDAAHIIARMFESEQENKEGTEDHEVEVHHLYPSKMNSNKIY